MAWPVSLFEEGLQKFRNDAYAQYTDAKDQAILTAFLAERTSADEVLQTAEGMKTMAGKKWSGLRIGQTQVISASWLNGIIANITPFTNTMEPMVGAAPHVGMAWAAVKVALSAIESNYQLYGLFGSGLTDITSVMVITQQYDRIYAERRRMQVEQSDVLNGLFAAIRDTYVKILQFSLSVRRHLAGNALAKLRHGIKDVFGMELAKFQDKLSEIARAKADVLDMSQGVFQEESLQRLGEIHPRLQNVQQAISEFREVSDDHYQQQLAMHAKLLKTLEERNPGEPLSRWDRAKREYDRIKRRLKPLGGAQDILQQTLHRRHAGTCEWIFSLRDFQTWYTSSHGAVLCLTGPAHAGKSIVIGTVVSRVGDQANHDNTAILYFSCDKSHSPEGRYDDLNRVIGTLVYSLYELAAINEQDADILERCNQVLSNPKRGAASAVLGKRTEEDLPDLADALSRLSKILAKRLIVAVDAIDRLPPEDQTTLFGSLSTLADPNLPEADSVRVLVGCRSGAAFDQSTDHLLTVEVDRHTKDDMAKALRESLSDLTNLTQSERTEVEARILGKAGYVFQYIHQIAIPFMRQPLRRPISDYLDHLPEGINETYQRFIESLAPNQLALLRTALTWTLFARQRVRVAEIMQDFSGIYGLLADQSREIGANDDMVARRFVKATPLEVEQLTQAAGPFLVVTADRDGQQTWVTPRDRETVARFCLSAENQDLRRTSIKQGLCNRCDSAIGSAIQVFVSPKDAHLSLATTMVYHLSNVLFQRRFYYNPVSQEDASVVENSTQVTSPSTFTAENDVAFDHSESFRSPHTPMAMPIAELDASEKEVVLMTGEGTAQSLQHNVAEYLQLATAHPCANGTHDADEHDDSLSDYFPDPEDRLEGRMEEDDTPNKVDPQARALIARVNLRYEILFWADHVREAERLSTPEERRKSGQWNELMLALEDFVCNHPAAWAEWQRCLAWADDNYFDDIYYGAPRGPLHIAAFLGLTSWAEYLLKHGEGVEQLTAGMTPLQAAALYAKSRSMLQLLLAWGADLNRSTERYGPAATLWITSDPSAEAIRLIIEHGADLTAIDQLNGWSILHYFAANGKDPAALTLMLSNPEPKRRPDIDRRAHDGRTALHILLDREDVPLDLLQAFIDFEADINVDDEESHRPLQTTAYYGDIKTLQALLQSGRLTHIDDLDRYGRCALHDAAWQGQLRCVQELLEYRSDPSIRDNSGRTPLFLACVGGHEETIKVLLQSMQSMGMSALEINRSSKGGRTPLRQVASWGFADLIEALLQGCTPSEAKTIADMADTNKGLTALHYAAWKGNVDCVQALLGHDADANVKDVKGRTPLMMAYEQWTLSDRSAYESIVSLLIDQNTALAVQDSDLIASAAAKGSTVILEKLNMHNADFNRPDRFGWTPMLLVRQSQNSDAERLLRRITASQKLPARWLPSNGRESILENGCRVDYPSGNHLTLSADKPVPSELDRYYFEVELLVQDEIEETGNTIMAIGFGTTNAESFNFPGLAPKDAAPLARSWAYHSDDGGVFHNSRCVAYESLYRPGATVGCGVDLRDGTIWFTHNGQRLRTAFPNVSGRFMPLLGVRHGVRVRTNFGSEPFLWQELEETVDVVSNKDEGKAERVPDHGRAGQLGRRMGQRRARARREQTL